MKRVAALSLKQIIQLHVSFLAKMNSSDRLAGCNCRAKDNDAEVNIHKRCTGFVRGVCV